MDSRAGSSGARRVREGILWVALAVALSPSVVHVCSMFASYAWTRSVIVGAGLLIAAIVAHRGDAPERLPRIGVAALVGGLLMQLIGIASDSWSIARLGLPVAACGMAAFLGRPSLPVMALAFWTVPIPNMLVVSGSPWLESASARLATETFRLFGVAIDRGGPLLRLGGDRLEFTDYDGGVLLAVLLAGLGWYAAVRAGASRSTDLPRALGRSLRWCALVLVLQPAVALVAVGLLVAGAPRAGAHWLAGGYWVAVAACGFTWIEWQTRTARRPLAPSQPPAHS